MAKPLSEAELRHIHRVRERARQAQAHYMRLLNTPHEATDAWRADFEAAAHEVLMTGQAQIELADSLGL